MFPRTPLKFQDGTFGAIKIFGKKISPEVLPDVNRKFQCLVMVSEPLILRGLTYIFYYTHGCSRQQLNQPRQKIAKNDATIT